MDLKKEVMKKKLALLQKKLAQLDCESPEDEMEVEISMDKEEPEEEEALASEAPQSESDIMAEEEDDGREELREFMRGPKPKKKKGERLVFMPPSSKGNSSLYKSASKSKKA